MPDRSGQAERRAAPPSAAEVEASRTAVWDEHLNEVRAALRHDSGQVSEALLGPPEQRHGVHMRCPGALEVAVSGPHAGPWIGRSTSTGGGMLALIQDRHGGSFGQAVAWARGQLGIPDPDYIRPLDIEAGRRMEARTAALAAEDAARKAVPEAAKLAGQEMVARRLRRERAVVPALPPWKGHEAGGDWNDYRAHYCAEATAEGFRWALGLHAARTGQAPMPDNTAPPPVPPPALPPQAAPGRPAAAEPAAPPPAPAAAPAEPRRRLTEAMALEAATAHGMALERAVEMARRSVAAMSDEQVRDMLDSLPERGWAMRPDGRLAPPEPPADPMAALLQRMQAEAGPLAETHPAVVATVTALAGRIEHLRHDRLRTRVAWAAEDMEKALGRSLDMPLPLRMEVTERAKTSPGLANQGMKALLAETRTLRDPGLVAAIRQEAARMARRPEADQRSAEAVERVERLAERVRITRPSAPPEAVPPPAAPAVQAASPGPGPQASPPVAAPPPSPQRPQAQAGPGFAEALARGQAARAMGSGPPWDAAPADFGLGDRLARLSARIAQGNAARLVSAATRDGDAALRALQALAAAGADPPPDLRRRALAAVQRYGDARVRAEDAAAGARLDGARLAPLLKLDEQVAARAAALPGVERGNSLLEEVAGRAAEVLREAAQRAAAAVAGAVAALKPKPATQPHAAPSPAP